MFDFEADHETILYTSIAGIVTIGIFVWKSYTARARQVQNATRPHPAINTINPLFNKPLTVALRPNQPDITTPLHREHPDGWSLSRAVLDQLIVTNPDSRDNLELGAALLIDALENNPNLNRINKYSSTFAKHMLDKAAYLTPQQAINAFRREYDAHGMSERAIYLLGGLFVIGTEAERQMTTNQIRTRHILGTRWGSDRMRRGTVQDTSRFTWKLTMYRPFGNIAFWDLLRSACAVLRSNRPHGRVQDGAVQILMPTTVFGSSATIMKVMTKCEALGMTPEQSMTIAFAVAQHWIDKKLDNKNDSHSLIEALQGAYTYLGMEEGAANQVIATQIRTLGPTVYANPSPWIVRTVAGF